MSRIRRFINESWSELKKVSWPTREQVRNLTVLVFAVSFAIREGGRTVGAGAIVSIAE